MLFLILLVLQGVFSGAGPGRDACVGVFCDILVGLLGSLMASPLEGFRYVVDRVLL